MRFIGLKYEKWYIESCLFFGKKMSFTFVTNATNLFQRLNSGAKRFCTAVWPSWQKCPSGVCTK